MLTTLRTALALRIIGPALAALFLAWAALALAAPKVVGITSAVVNDVRIQQASSAQFAKAKIRQRVALADRIRTGSRSRMQVLLLDRTKFSVGANAQLTIDRFVYDPNGGAMAASVAKGAFRFMSGTSRKAKKSVSTPSATIGIRGTVFDGAVGQVATEIARRESAVPRDTRHDPLTATLIVLRGPGKNRQAPLPVGLIDVTGADKTVTLDSPLLAAYVPHDGARPIGPFLISLSGLGLLTDFIVPPPQRDFKPFTEDQLPFPQDRPRPPPQGFRQPGAVDETPGFGGEYIPDQGSFPAVPQGRPMPDPAPTRAPQPPAGTAPDPAPTHSTNTNPNNY